MSIICNHCKKPLTKAQIWKARGKKRKPGFCSIACSEQSLGISTSLREPTSNKELEEFDLAVAKAKEEVINDTRELVRAQSPIDDSPEAERLLRALLCPHGYEYDSKSLPDDGENYGNSKRKYA